MRRIPICLLLLMAVACLDTERRRRDDEPSPPPSGETGEGEREGGLPCLPQAKLDLLWVISNSGSMCQEQTSLGRDFVTFSEQLVRLSADVNVAIITTDAEDPARSGRFQNTPATDHNVSCEQPCLEDAQCGGGCLCGVPYLRRCATDAGCGPDERCLAAADGGVRHCAQRCDSPGPAHLPASDRCGCEMRQDQVLTCQDSDAGGDSYCLLTPCWADADCNAGDGQVCVPSADGLSYCRSFRTSRTVRACVPGVAGQCPLDVPCLEQADGTGRCAPIGQCPPATCDCPKELPRVLHSSDPDLKRNFRCLTTVGTRGDTFEKGLEAMEKALSPELTAPGGPNSGFLRDDALLGVVLLSHDNDCSDAVQTCHPDEACVVCLPDGRCRGTTEDDSVRCQFDEVWGEHYCRLPCRDGSQCEHLRDWLVPVEHYVEVLAAVKGGADRVSVGALVGPKDHMCVLECPSPEPPQECVPDAGCELDCDVALGDPEAFCAERVFDSGPSQPTCTSERGQAYTGRRYIELARAFGAHGAHGSICGDPEAGGGLLPALVPIGEALAAAVEANLCLP